jgi:hypothetical protein
MPFSPWFLLPSLITRGDKAAARRLGEAESRKTPLASTPGDRRGNAGLTRTQIGGAFNRKTTNAADFQVLEHSQVPAPIRNAILTRGQYFLIDQHKFIDVFIE